MRIEIGDRLPKFSNEEIELLRNSVDFVGLNHYTSRFIAYAEESPEEGDFYKAQKMARIGKSRQLWISLIEISETFFNSNCNALDGS